MARLILKDDLGLKQYKLPDLHEIEAGDYQKKLDFCCWVKGLPYTAIEWFIFSDESYFELTQSANKQNNRLWLKTRPTEGVEHPLYDKKVLVFCAMSSKRIYGPYFFESTVNEERYHKILVHFFWPKIVREDFRKYYFQQDGASPHREKKVHKYFQSKFIDKKKCPPRTCDLNPCDYFLWSNLKSKVHYPLPSNLNDLKVNIANEIKN